MVDGTQGGGVNIFSSYLRRCVWEGVWGFLMPNVDTVGGCVDQVGGKARRSGGEGGVNILSSSRVRYERVRVNPDPPDLSVIYI